MKNGKSRAVPPIASGTSLSERTGGGVEEKDEEVAVAEEKSVEVVAESVVSVEEAEVAVPIVRLPVAVKGEGGKRRRVEVSGDGNEEEVGKVEEILVALLGPRAICGGLLRRVGKESMFKDADPRLVAGGGSTPAAVGVSWQSEAWRQSPEASGGYQLRPRVGNYGYRGRGYGMRGRGV